MHHQQLAALPKEADRGEIRPDRNRRSRMLAGFTASVLVCRQQGVAVGRRARDLLRRDGAAGAAAIFDDDRLPQRRGASATRARATHRPARPGGRHDDADRFAG